MQGTWRYRDSTFTAARLIATLIYPATTFEVSRPLQWTAVDAVQVYYLYVGSTPGAKDLVSSGEMVATSYSVPRLPGGQVVYARLWTKIGGLWRYSDSSFTVTAPSGSP